MKLYHFFRHSIIRLENLLKFLNQRNLFSLLEIQRSAISSDTCIIFCYFRERCATSASVKELQADASKRNIETECFDQPE